MQRTDYLGWNMKVRILGVTLLVGLLLGCKQMPAGDVEGVAAAVPVPASPGKPSADSVAEIVDTESSPYEEGDPEGDALTPAAFDYEPSCEEAPLATHFFTLVGGNTVEHMACAYRQRG